MSECGKDEFWLFCEAPRNLKEKEEMICGLQILPFPSDFEENCGELQRFLF